MASKQYISIIRLFNHCGISTEGEFNLSRAKKQLQAEFGISQEGFIEVEGHVYSRHDVFEEIERPDFLNRLVFHQQIWMSPQVLQLLENNIADFAAIQDEFQLLSGDNEFDAFFSPYFAGPFNYISRTLLGDSSLEQIADLLRYEEFLLPADREEAFRPLRVFLDENLKILRNTNEDNYSMMRPKIAHWIDTDWFGFFNNLPPEFYETKNDMTILLINVGVAIQKSHRKDCKKMSQQLISLQETPESLRGTIVSNHAVYNSSRSFTPSWGGGFGIVWIIIMLFRAVSSNGCSDDNNQYKNIPVNFTTIKKLNDSLSQRASDSIFWNNQDNLKKQQELDKLIKNFK